MPEVDYLKVKDVAKELNISHDTAFRRFENRPGVLLEVSPETPNKRRYRMLRIPRQVLNRYIAERTVK